jgi:hypothetical protein
MIQDNPHNTTRRIIGRWHDALTQIQQLDEDWQMDYGSAISILLAELAPLHPTSLTSLLEIYISSADSIMEKAADEIQELNGYRRTLSQGLLKDATYFVWLHELLNEPEPSIS